MLSFPEFKWNWSENAELAEKALQMQPTKGIPHTTIYIMEHNLIEELAGVEQGEYKKCPEKVYLKMQKEVGTCFIDQYIPRNPLTMGDHGYDGSQQTASAGIEKLVLDSIDIDSPEAVVEHMENFLFPSLRKQIEETSVNDSDAVKKLIEQENNVQQEFGSDILKVPYANGFQSKPILLYTTYGYANYLMAYILFPEIIEKGFSLMADLAEKLNSISARAIIDGNLPRVIRFDHDMASSQGMLVNIKSLDKIWFPHFERSIKPLLNAGIRLIWHCDGNLMEMVPRLLEVGFGGFQGFQYEDGMDYEKICKMTDRNGSPLMIWGGVSVTQTLPNGSPEDVKKEIKWLVKYAPEVGFALAGSSSIAPGTNHENIRTMLEGLKYYREHGRG